MAEQPEVISYGPREREIICLGPRVDRKQGYTQRSGEAANIQNQTWCVGYELWEHIFGEEGRENIVGMNECVNVLVGNAVDREVGPGLGVANVVEQNSYMELLERREEGGPVFDTLAGIRTDNDYIQSSVCSLELGLDSCEFLSVAAVDY